jgi:hypothetical protein
MLESGLNGRIIIISRVCVSQIVQKKTHAVAASPAHHKRPAGLICVQRLGLIGVSPPTRSTQWMRAESCASNLAPPSYKKVPQDTKRPQKEVQHLQTRESSHTSALSQQQHRRGCFRKSIYHFSPRVRLAIRLLFKKSAEMSPTAIIFSAVTLLAVVGTALGEFLSGMRCVCCVWGSNGLAHQPSVMQIQLGI